LALKQVEEIIPVLQDAFCRGAARCARPTFEIVPIHTPGDLDKTTPLAHTDGSDFFTKTIEDALLGGEIDMAVHSAKDLEDTMPANLCIALMTESVSPHEALVTRSGGTLSSLPTGAVVGTSSPKRAAAIRALRPDLIVRDIRGTIEERIAQVDEGRYDALVVAHAALLRLGILDRMAQLFTADEMPPHPMQGRLAVQVRTDRRDLIERLEMSYAAR
jgi:hydroxymethylbilane synthase